MALRPLGRKDSVMSIEIDKAKFKDAIKGKFTKYLHAAKGLEYADAILDTMQEWLDLEEWKNDPEIDTLREVRIRMRCHIVSQLKPNKNQSWYVDSHMWRMLARQMSLWAVKRVAEEYWGEMAAEKGLPPED